MSAKWRTCKCGNKMETTNCWDYKSRLACSRCGLVRHVQHIKVTEILKFNPSKKNSQMATGSKK